MDEDERALQRGFEIFLTSDSVVTCNKTSYQ